MALDLMLKTLQKSPEFQQLHDKNWDAISRMVPGTTPKQCQRRYEELQRQMSQSEIGVLTTKYTVYKPPDSVFNSKTAQPGREAVSRPASAKQKPGSAVSKGDEDKQAVTFSSQDQGPVMVIRVSDEAKNLKQDFNCPRDLLVQEMKYFAEYLTTDAQRWEEVDISVHCDVQIFDWLMKYVKRKSKEVDSPPKLDPSNVISILISSDFLKMDSLVQHCIEFCHANMNAIVATPCNMNCINDKLIARVADLFTHSEADDIKDRKDKFKSKLFAKKLEKLFNTEVKTPDSPENASTLYRCAICKKLLTKNLESKLRCGPSRMTVDHYGQLSYRHMRDTSWDVNDYLIELKSQLKSWRDVYWRVWGVINYLTCSRCAEMFPCSELGHCRYHPENPNFDVAGSAALGKFPCCGQTRLRFDPILTKKGCKVRDHVIALSDGDSNATLSGKNTVYQDVLNHRESVCVPCESNAQQNEDVVVDVFADDEIACGIRKDPLAPTQSDTSLSEDLWPQPRLQALTVERQVSLDDDIGADSDDEIGDDESEASRKTRITRKSRVTVDPQAILVDAPDFSTTKTRKWDSSRSLRWNQDAQREEDQRRMNDIVAYLSKLRLNAEKSDRLRNKEFAGGIYCKLEAQWKAANMPPPKPAPTQFRGKMRPGQLKAL